MSFFRNAASILLTSVVTVPLSLATTAILARGLTETDRGLWQVSLAFAGIVVLFGNLGWPMSSVYRIKRMGSSPAQVVTAGLVVNAFLSLLCLGVCWLFQDVFIHHFLDDSSPRIFWLGLATVPFLLFLRLFSYVAKGIDRYALRNWANLWAVLGRVFLLFLVLVIMEGDVVTALWANLVATAVVVIATGAVIVRHTGLSRRIEPGEIRESLGYGLRNYVQSMAGQLHEQIDIFMLALLLSDHAQVAIYAIAVGVVGQLKIVPESIGLALFPKLAGASEAEAGRFTAYVSRHSMTWMLLASVAVAIVVPVGVPLLYGEPYRASLAPLYVLLPAMVMLTIYRVLARYFIALNRQRVNIWSQIVSVVVNVGLNLVLIPRYGVLGAALSSLVSYTLEAVIIVIAFRSASGQSLRATFVFRWPEVEVYRSRVLRVLRRLGWSR